MIPLIVAAIGGLGSYLFIDKAIKKVAPKPGTPGAQPAPQPQFQPPGTLPLGNQFPPPQPQQPQQPFQPPPQPQQPFQPPPQVSPQAPPQPQPGGGALPIRARVTTNDPAPAGDVYLRTSPTAAGIPGVGAEKNGIVTVLSNEGEWCKATWPGGSRLGPATGYVKTKFLTFI